MNAQITMDISTPKKTLFYKTAPGTFTINQDRKEIPDEIDIEEQEAEEKIVIESCLVGKAGGIFGVQ
jgi:hypothetical protein